MKQLQFIEKNSPIKTARQELDSLIKNHQALIFLKISFSLFFLMWLLVGIFYRFLPPQIPLFFSKPWGESQLVIKQYIFILPGVITFLFIINSRLASISIRDDKLLSFLFLWTQVTLSLLASITLLRIILLLA